MTSQEKKDLIDRGSDGLKGDGDLPASANEGTQLVQFGREYPQTCPSFETKRFTLRLVAEADTEDLFRCYSDPLAQRFFNADRCIGGFNFTQVEEMAECIRIWIECYHHSDFVRWSIVDRSSGHAVGTVEMFGDPEQWGVLRVDVASGYEDRDLLKELFDLAAQHFFSLFQVRQILTKAIPDAVERIAALEAAGYAPASFADREDYFSLER